MTTSNAFRSAAARGSEPGILADALADTLALDAGTVVPESTFGLLYLSDSMARHGAALLKRLQAATGVRHWTGCAGMALIGGREEFYETPAAVALVGTLAPEDFRLIKGPVDAFDGLLEQLQGFLSPEQPGRLILHADPGFAGLEDLLTRIDQETAWFTTGGVSSGQGEVVQFAGSVVAGGVSGLALREIRAAGRAPHPGLFALARAAPADRDLAQHHRQARRAPGPAGIPRGHRRGPGAGSSPRPRLHPHRSPDQRFGYRGLPGAQHHRHRSGPRPARRRRDAEPGRTHPVRATGRPGGAGGSGAHAGRDPCTVSGTASGAESMSAAWVAGGTSSATRARNSRSFRTPWAMSRWSVSSPTARSSPTGSMATPGVLTLFT
jgi:hypothetical protein